MHVLSEESGAGEQRQQVDFLSKARKDKKLMFPQKSDWNRSLEQKISHSLSCGGNECT